MDLQQVYTQLGILFVLMLIGYVAGKREWIPAEGIKVLSGLVVKIAMPALIVNGMLLPFSTELVKQSMQLLIISVGFYGLLCIGVLVWPKNLIKDGQRRSIYQLTLVFANVGFIGYPVLQAMLGKEIIFSVVIYNIPFNILIYTLGLKIIQGGMEEGEKFQWKKLLNPGTIASVVGVLCFVLQVSLPAVVVGTLEGLASLCTPISMLVTGAMLARTNIGAMFKEKSLYGLSLIRTIAVPAVVFVVLKYVLGIASGPLLIIPVMVVAMPAASNVTLLATEYDCAPEFASKITFMSTLISGITIPLWVILFQ